MRAMFARVRVLFFAEAAILALVAGSPSTNSADEPKPPADKVRIRSLDERYAQVVAGVRKLKEAEVVALLGPAHTMKRPVAKKAGQLPADRELSWELTTRITIRYKDGKVSEVVGVFSDFLPVERVTPDTFRRVQVGMTQKEVIEILGDRYATLTVGDGLGDQWGETYSIQLYFDKDDLLVSQQRTGHSYGSRKE
jgi:hypothetical protein